MVTGRQTSDPVCLLLQTFDRVIWGVTPALHSPLMSVTNAISGLVRSTVKTRKRLTDL